MFGTVALVSVVWVLYGYSIAFSTVDMKAGDYNLNSFFGTLVNGGLSGISIFSSTGNYPASVFITFHMMFACITTALVTGAFAERMKVSAVWAFAVCWSTLVYCPLAHQVWGGDGAFLHSLGAIDFAGGIVVHISSGISGLTSAVIVGKRLGYPRIPKAPHSLVLTHIGGALLWVGWFGFNAGSATAADFIAGQAMLVTQIASASGVIGWTAIEHASYRRPSSLGMVSGAIAGLVAITPASGSVGVMAAILIGFVSGVLCFCFCTYVKEAIGTYDDSLDVFGIHGIGGITGAILTAIWCAPRLGGNGFGVIVLSGGEEHPIEEIGTQIGVQIASVCYAVVWSVVSTFLILKIIDVFHGGFHWRLTGLTHIRSTPKEEEVGLDDAYFAEQGYNFVAQDMKISVEVGPLRGRKGHGLQLYYTDEEGTRHPISFESAETAEEEEEQLEATARIQASAAHGGQDPRYHENIARALYADGGVVQMKRQGNDGKVVADKVSLPSTPGDSQHGTDENGEKGGKGKGARGVQGGGDSSPPGMVDSRVHGGGAKSGAGVVISSPISTLHYSSTGA